MNSGMTGKAALLDSCRVESGVGGVRLSRVQAARLRQFARSPLGLNPP